jgi:hypothetical protein
MKTNLLTLPQVAKALEVTPRQADFAIQREGIQAAMRAGNIRLYGPDEVAEIRSAIGRTRTRESESEAR